MYKSNAFRLMVNNSILSYNTNDGMNLLYIIKHFIVNYTNQVNGSKQMSRDRHKTEKN